MNQHFVIIVAAGTGTRLGGDLPKQYQLLADKPILMQTILKFSTSQIHPKIIVVLAKGMEALWDELCQKHQFELEHYSCVGGSSRFQSVKNALIYIQEQFKITKDTKIAVHDAARPLITSQLIDQLYSTCDSSRPAVIPAVASSNSIRIGDQHNSRAIDRNQVWQVQTPQTFLGELLMEAYQQEEDLLFTDDASVVEKMSNIIHLIPGENHNLKITYEEDLIIAHYLFNKFS
ncbi:2-C-methyl-D-erythritol 4-phosphate cytidylyltransferase [Sphingobacterium sp. HJSM2_6]|uniref:2-C-methyl-D-erythritol 4-phosphate cytidylyltransferase n=1 Tax=Sphingobacterium sp. HJSM2_6 TaxID=3366264 RepID=UPI003BD60358